MVAEWREYAVLLRQNNAVPTSNRERLFRLREAVMRVYAAVLKHYQLLLRDPHLPRSTHRSSRSPRVQMSRARRVGRGVSHE